MVKLRSICLTDGINSSRLESTNLQLWSAAFFLLFILLYRLNSIFSRLHVRERVYCILYFRIKAAAAKTITREPKAGSAVPRVKLSEEKLRKSPTRAVTAKLNPMEKVNLSIISSASSLGNSVSVRQ